MTTSVEHRGFTFHVVDRGEGPAVLFLHGFPDSSELWRHQVAAVEGRGFRAIAPDLLGYGGSSRPLEVQAYRLEAILGDVLALLDGLGVEQARVVGHDWGATLGWLLAAFHPQRVESLVALSVGHPNAFLDGGIRQLRRSWYMLLFLWEGVAEKLLAKDDGALLRALGRDHPEPPGWLRDLEDPSELTPALNWYRANVSPARWLENPEVPDVGCDVVGVWSDGDPYLTEEQMTGSEPFVEGEWSYVRMTGAGHWIPLERPDELGRLIAGTAGEQPGGD